MTQKNQRIYAPLDHLRMLEAEHKNYIGRDTKLDVEQGCLIVYALPRRYKKLDKRRKREREKRERRDRDLNRDED
jgi:hypothetical protein